MNLPAVSKTPLRSVVPVVPKLFARNLALWSGKRTTFFGLKRNSSNYIPDLELLFSWLKAKKISVPIKAIFPLDDVKAAHREYAASQGMGPIIIVVNG